MPYDGGDLRARLYRRFLEQPSSSANRPRAHFLPSVAQRVVLAHLKPLSQTLRSMTLIGRRPPAWRQRILLVKDLTGFTRCEYSAVGRSASIWRARLPDAAAVAGQSYGR